MALFKIKKGLKANLPKTYNEGYCYFTTDDGKMYIDTTNASSGRVCLNAAKADALTVANKGSATNPVYFVGGIPTECGFTVQSNVPANAKFTDTTYSAATSSAAGLMSAADKAKLDGIASGATANTGDITGVTAGKGLTGGGSSGSVTLNVGAGAGLTVADDSIGHTNSVTAKTTYNQATATPGYGGKFKITEPKYDAQGHITGVQVAEITMPSAPTAMTGATANAAGKSGLVPAPAAGENSEFLRGDGTWAIPTDAKVSQTRSTSSSWRPLLSHNVAGTYNTNPGSSTSSVYYHESIAMQPSTGTIQATNFKGTLVGNADTATKATQDGSGNVITSTYETKTNAAAKLTEAKSYTDTKIAGLVDSAPETLNTLNELAAALGDDENFATTVATNIGKKADKTIKISAGTGLTGGGTLEADRTLSLATISGLTAGTYGPSANASGSGASITIPQFAIDAYGRVTAASSKTYTGPTIDSAMNSSSTNPVQNKVIKAYIDGKVPNMSAYLPKSAGPDHKITGPLGLTEGQNYGTTLPSTGFDGQLFFLEDDTPSLPLGGEAGQALIKNSTADGDASWKDIVALPKGGSAGQVLIKNSTTDGDASWSTKFTYSDSVSMEDMDVLVNNHGLRDQSYCLAASNGNFVLGREWGWNTDNNNFGMQLRIDGWNGQLYTRSYDGWGSTWTNWKKYWKEGDAVTGAVWNDYAECRESDCEEFGYVLMENGDDTLSKTTERLSHFAGISSDTWGFSQGETDKAKTPIAVAGRVLAYPYQDRNNYKPGDCVCAAPGGTVDIMTREEVINWPDRIVGTVSCVPDYEEWGGGENADRPSVKVNNRIWIKVK